MLLAPIFDQPNRTRPMAGMDAGAKAQTVVNKGYQATLRQQRKTGGQYFADVYMVAAAIRRGYRYIDMVGVVVG